MNLRRRVSLLHLDRMTDSTGLIQHAIFCVPRRESGYTTDDNARALRLCVRLWNRRPNQSMLTRVSHYLSFLEHARCAVRGFHNFLSYQRDWLDASGTGDCQGQAVLALAEVCGSSLPIDYRILAQGLLEESLPALAELRSIRAQAYIVQAWGQVQRCPVDEVKGLGPLALAAADRLVECYNRSRREDWAWFESRLTYANAVLPHALFIAGQLWPQSPYLDTAIASFDFLEQVTTEDDVFWPIGNSEWYSRGENKSEYDQQPVEASTMADAAVAAYAASEDPRYLRTFHRAHSWFHGRNSAGHFMADAECGSCCDGIQPYCINRNQGAESTLAYLLTETQCLHDLPRPQAATTATE